MFANLRSWMSYNSVKLIKVKNKPLAMLYYAITALVLVYVIVYSVVLNKGYQDYDTLVGSTMVKVKGSAHIGDLSTQAIDDITVYDANDLVIPPLQPNSAFITTNLVTTINQSRGYCPGDDSDELCACGLGSVALCCAYGQHTNNGMKTGNCSADGVYCEMKAWCPLEVDPDNDDNLLVDVQNFTVYARVNIRFPKFNVFRDNVEEVNGVENTTTLGYNLWYVKDIIRLTGNTWEDMASKGGIIVANFEFNCNLDKPADECTPDISFFRLDTNDNGSISSGFNYRYINEYRDNNNVLRRDLTKVYGIQLIFQAFGKAGKFSWVALLLTFGAGLGLLGLSTVICDFIMQAIIPNHDKYTSAKYEVVVGEDEYEQIDGERVSRRASRRELSGTNGAGGGMSSGGGGGMSRPPPPQPAQQQQQHEKSDNLFTDSVSRGDEYAPL